MSSLSMSIPSASTIVDILPKLLFAFVCFAFMMQRSAVCKDSTHGTGWARFTDGLCTVSEAAPLTPLAILLFVVTVIKLVRRAILNKQLKKSKQQ